MAHVGRLISRYRCSVANLHRQQVACLSSASQAKLKGLAPKVREFIEQNAAITQPADIHICDGSEAENQNMLNMLADRGVLTKLKKHKNCWHTTTDPRDVARVESKTVICTPNERDTVPTPAEGVKGTLGKWISESDMAAAKQERFPGCMKGRTMYVIPFSMGPIGSPLSKIGIEITDSPYVVASMNIMTRVGSDVLKTLDNADFVKALHSVGSPLDGSGPGPKWPCNPEKTIIAHVPANNEIVSFGSGYGGNSLLGKKCFALRLGSILARDEGWLAEHMLILGITNPKGVKKYIAAAFPSACGKTNLAMMIPTLPGYKVECVGDDIAWMRFDSEGRLRAINPENGFFGVCPGTSMDTNPNAMVTIQENTLFTNTAITEDGTFYWEGLEKDLKPGTQVTSWLGDTKWTKDSDKPSSHPNSRFCTPARQCPMMDPLWESPEGVPIDAILFGGRRPQGVPLVYEAFDWNHGVFLGAAMRSEATAAAEHKGKVIMHDPFAMRPFFGYNAGDYFQHWLNMGQKQGLKLPKIYHVNWFRKSAKGGFLWPGFGENSRVLDWIVRRLSGEDVAQPSAIGNIPKPGTINTDGLGSINEEELFSLPRDFWQKEVQEIRTYFDNQLPQDLPEGVKEQLHKLEERVNKM